MTIVDAHVSGGIEIGGTAPVAFTHGTGQVDGDVVVEIDWDNDGDFDQPEENVTGHLVDAESLTGRDFPSQLTGKAGPGLLKVNLRNDDGRYSFFNQASPLNQAPFSLGSGHKIRLRTTDAANPDPVLLARDRFDDAGVLGVDELGNPWTNQTVPRFVRDGGYAVLDTFDPVAGEPGVGTIDPGVDDYYVQVTSRQRTGGNTVGIVYRWLDADNYGHVLVLGNGTLRHTVITGGAVTSDAALYTFGAAQDEAEMTFGVNVQGSTATVYLEGVPVGTATAAGFASNLVGIYGQWPSDNVPGAAPAYGRFDVWSTVPAEVEGILWTGEVSSVLPAAALGPDLTATVTAEGGLSNLATTEVTPTPQIPGYPTGIATGHILCRAGAAHPPGRLDAGDITTGAYGFDPAAALDLARGFEETEIGFLHEMNEGPVAYGSRSARVAAPVTVAFSDAPDTQFGYSSIVLADWRREVINQVRAGIAPSGPVVESVTTRTGNTAGGVANDVNVQMPGTVTAGDLLLVVIASTVRTAQQQWENVSNGGWAQLRGEGDALRVRGYAKTAVAGDGGRTYKFYDDAASGGAWVAKVYRISNWFGVVQGGVAQGDVAVSILSFSEPNGAGSTPRPLTTPWGLQPTLFIAARAGLTSATGGLDINAIVPHRYTSDGSTMVNGANDGFDVTLHTAHRQAYAATEAAEAFGSVGSAFSGWEFVNSCLFAVRGFNGTPPQAQGTVTIQVDDRASQDRHGGVPRTHTIPSNLFASVADAEAYAGVVLATYANDRPLVTITFWATISAAYRNQALRRRVGHKIHLTAVGDAGMGIDGQFFIESINHRLTDAGKVWQVTWQLSPA